MMWVTPDPFAFLTNNMRNTCLGINCLVKMIPTFRSLFGFHCKLEVHTFFLLLAFIEPWAVNRKLTFAKTDTFRATFHFPKTCPFFCFNDGRLESENRIVNGKVRNLSLKGVTL